MEEIKINEYVRTKDGQIVKLKNNEEFYEDSVDVGIGIIPEVNGIWIDKEYFEYIEKKNIVSHSSNIIDLIEVGDYVNGVEVIEIYVFREQKRLVMAQSMEYGYDNEMFDEHIKTILTKEMFEANVYKVEE